MREREKRKGPKRRRQRKEEKKKECDSICILFCSNFLHRH